MRTIIPPDLPGINVESALARLGNEEQLLADIIVSFRADNASTLEAIRNALETKDYDLARRLVSIAASEPDPWKSRSSHHSGVGQVSFQHGAMGGGSQAAARRIAGRAAARS